MISNKSKIYQISFRAIDERKHLLILRFLESKFPVNIFVLHYTSLSSIHNMFLNLN